MPDDPTNLPRGLEQRSIEHYTVKDFLTWASNYEPRTQLPAPYRYSNAGIGLLSYLVATATCKTWEDQVNSEILQPLGMADTTLRPTPEQQKRLAQGHHRAGHDAPRWPVFAWYAAGGLRSTAQGHDQLWRGLSRPQGSEWQTGFRRIDRGDAAGAEADLHDAERI